MEEHGICQHSQLPAMPGLLLYLIKFPAYVHRYFRNYLKKKACTNPVNMVL
jgi:hypothetical protein